MQCNERVSWLLLSSVIKCICLNPTIDLAVLWHFRDWLHLRNLNIFLYSYLLPIFGNKMAELVRVGHEPGRAVATHFNCTASCTPTTSAGVVLSWGDSIALNYTTQTYMAFRTRFKSRECGWHLKPRLSRVDLLAVVVKIVKKKTGFRLYLFRQVLLNLLLLTYRNLKCSPVNDSVGGRRRCRQWSVMCVFRTIFKLRSICAKFIFN